MACFVVNNSTKSKRYSIYNIGKVANRHIWQTGNKECLPCSLKLLNPSLIHQLIVSGLHTKFPLLTITTINEDRNSLFSAKTQLHRSLFVWMHSFSTDTSNQQLKYTKVWFLDLRFCCKATLKRKISKASKQRQGKTELKKEKHRWAIQSLFLCWHFWLLVKYTKYM